VRRLIVPWRSCVKNFTPSQENETAGAAWPSVLHTGAVLRQLNTRRSQSKARFSCQCKGARRHRAGCGSVASSPESSSGVSYHHHQYVHSPDENPLKASVPGCMPMNPTSQKSSFRPAATESVRMHRPQKKHRRFPERNACVFICVVTVWIVVPAHRPIRPGW
jgi:hypothetical protein